MNPPVEPMDAGMFHELMLEIRHVRDRIEAVDTKIDEHITDESAEFAGIREDMGEIRKDVGALKTKLGLLAAVAAMVASGLVQIGVWIVTHFFRP